MNENGSLLRWVSLYTGPGDIFDTGYFQVFMQSVARQFDLRGMRVSQNQVLHRDTQPSMW